MKSEEKEEDLSVGVVCPKNYEEPESCRSAANFLLGVAMEGDSLEVLLRRRQRWSQRRRSRICWLVLFAPKIMRNRSRVEALRIFYGVWQWSEICRGGRGAGGGGGCI